MASLNYHARWSNPAKRPILKNREKVELALIPIAVGAVGLAGRFLPAHMGTGSLLALCCLVWLGQGGVRDLWLLHLLKSRPGAAPRRKLACMCFESSAGLTGLLVGVGLAIGGVGGTIGLSPARWMVLTAGVLTLGFLARELVISWHPLGVRREPDHHSIIFTWR